MNRVFAKEQSEGCQLTILIFLGILASIPNKLQILSYKLPTILQITNYPTNDILQHTCTVHTWVQSCGARQSFNDASQFEVSSALEIVGEFIKLEEP